MVFITNSWLNHNKLKNSRNFRNVISRKKDHFGVIQILKLWYYLRLFKFLGLLVLPNNIKIMKGYFRSKNGYYKESFWTVINGVYYSCKWHHILFLRHLQFHISNKHSHFTISVIIIPWCGEPQSYLLKNERLGRKLGNLNFLRSSVANVTTHGTFSKETFKFFLKGFSYYQSRKELETKCRKNWFVLYPAYPFAHQTFHRNQ